jgi:hypothetical protein
LETQNCTGSAVAEEVDGSLGGEGGDGRTRWR